MPCIPPIIVYIIFNVIFTSLYNTRSATLCVFIRIDICILCFHINYLYHCAIITYIPYFITYILWPKQLVHARHWALFLQVVCLCKSCK